MLLLFPSSAPPVGNLDTRSKRASSVGFLKSWAGALVLPDGALDQGDRQQISWTYSGVLAAGVGGGPVIPVFMNQYRQRRN